MSFLSGLGGPLAGGAISPMSGLGQVGGPMSGIGLLGKLFGGGGDGGEGPAAQPEPEKASFVSRLGNGMNQIAAAGGAQPGYSEIPGPTGPEVPRPANHLQLLDNDVLQSLLKQFQPAQPAMRAPNQMGQYQ